MRKIQHLLVFLSLIATYSCRLRKTSDADSNLEYKHHENSNLMSRIRDPYLRVCVKGSSTLSVNQSDLVKNALNYWLDPLRSFDSTITKEIRFECVWVDQYLMVTFHAEFGRSHTYTNMIGFYTNWDQINLYAGIDQDHIYTPDQVQDALIHEIGHAFGLGDLYLEDGSLQANQDQRSIMYHGGQMGFPRASISFDDTRALLIGYGNLFAKQTTLEVQGPKFRDRLAIKTGGEIGNVCFYHQQKRIELAFTRLDAENHNFRTALAALIGDANGHIFTIRSDDNQWYKEQKRSVLHKTHFEFIISQTHKYFPDPDDQYIQVHGSRFNVGAPDAACRVLSADGVEKIFRQFLMENNQSP